MDRYAVFVDAGYFFSAGARAVFGGNVARRLLSLKDPAQTIGDIARKAAAIADGDTLLRIYWYDAAPGGQSSPEQKQIAMLAGVKMRLGTLNAVGAQKGVDSMIVTDLVELARNGAIADAILIAGDADLTIAIEQAQSFGVRVHVMGAAAANKDVSLALQMEADSVLEIERQWFRGVLLREYEPAPASPTKDAEAGTQSHEGFEAAAAQVVAELLESEATKIVSVLSQFNNSASVPSELDARLLAKTGAIMHRPLASAERSRLRKLFVEAVRGRFDLYTVTADAPAMRGIHDRIAAAVRS